MLFFFHTCIFICIDFKKVKKDNSPKEVDIGITNKLSYDTDESSEKCKINALYNIIMYKY